MSLDYLSCFAVVPRGIHGKVDICRTNYNIYSKLGIFSLLWSHTWKYNIQADKRLTKVKEKWSTIRFDIFLSFFHFLHSYVPDNKCHKQKWHVIFFTCIKLVASVLACARAIASIKWIRLDSNTCIKVYLSLIIIQIFIQLF